MLRIKLKKGLFRRSMEVDLVPIGSGYWSRKSQEELVWLLEECGAIVIEEVPDPPKKQDVVTIWSPKGEDHGNENRVG